MSAIGRVAARRVFQTTSGKTVTLTVGVPQKVPGEKWPTWRCAIRIEGLSTSLARPRFVFGVDALQALELGLICACAELESSDAQLTWLGEPGDLGLPRHSLDSLPKSYKDRIEAAIERELKRYYDRMPRRPAASRKRKTPRRLAALT